MAADNSSGRSDPSRLERPFAAAFGGKPEWHVRAPGRVNLIGDHTDYNGLPVLPIAIQRNIQMLGRSRPDRTVSIINTNTDYPPCEFELSSVLSPDTPQWCNYIKAGAGALASRYGAGQGFEAVVSSTIPPAAGLSSSSALVVAAGLATARANGISLSPLVMMGQMARAERFVGTQGGGMDQAVCIGGRAGSAVQIEFEPLRLNYVEVPKEWCFVVAHSLERAEKSGSAQAAYNRRTAECRAALEQVIRVLDTRRVAERSVSYRGLLDNPGASDIVSLAEHVLDRTLAARFRHTVLEADRVLRGTVALSTKDLDGFGQLMRASHRSLQVDYEVSTNSLDLLVDRFLQAGAVGARLTGAGFGGCVVALCAASETDQIIEQVSDFYDPPRGAREVTTDCLFACVPSGGAQIADW